MAKNVVHWFENKKRLYFIRFNLFACVFGIFNIILNEVSAPAPNFFPFVIVTLVLVGQLAIAVATLRESLDFDVLKYTTLLMVHIVLPFLWFISVGTNIHFYWGLVAIIAVTFFYGIKTACVSSLYFYGCFFYLKTSRIEIGEFKNDEFLESGVATFIIVFSLHYLNQAIAGILREYSEKERQLLQNAYSSSIEHEEELELKLKDALFRIVELEEELSQKNSEEQPIKKAQ